MYVIIDSPCGELNTNVPPIVVGTETGHQHKSVSSCIIPLTKLPFRQGHIMPTFCHNLMGIGTLFDKGRSVIYDNTAVIVLSPTI